MYIGRQMSTRETPTIDLDSITHHETPNDVIQAVAFVLIWTLVDTHLQCPTLIVQTPLDIS
jgi:hypothetical protein